ncbi:hypothetical protein C0991_002935 [Blastosporella zonata]|nr:hypothetical protein C0991_002935 [Blastosporella zonata]
MYLPYFAVDEYQTAPKGCRVTQAKILQRHGARYTTSGASKGILGALAKLTSVDEDTDSSLDFLKSYTYILSTDNLVPFGASQSMAAGQEHYERYKYLLGHDQLPFVRSDSAQRAVDSATNWTAGCSLQRVECDGLKSDEIVARGNCGWNRRGPSRIVSNHPAIGMSNNILYIGLHQFGSIDMSILDRFESAASERRKHVGKNLVDVLIGREYRDDLRSKADFFFLGA